MAVKTASHITIIVLLLTFVGCQSMKQAIRPTTMDKTLFERLGGRLVLAVVVDDFVGRVAADSRINGKFANADIPRLKVLLVEQICWASGGPCTYTGRSMKAPMPA